MSVKSFAKQIVDQGYNIVPLFPYSKNNQDINWQKRKYSIDDVLDDSNLGINLGQSNLIDVDLDCDLAVHFGSLFLCLLYTSPSPRDGLLSRMPSSA